MYNKDHGTTIMNCHVVSKHFATLKLYQIWHFSDGIQSHVYQTILKTENPNTTFIVDFCSSGISYKKIDPTQE
jgi:hypothetical protein